MLKTIDYRADLCVVGGGIAGMCAAIAAKNSETPSGVYLHHLSELQTTLLWDDVMLPHITRIPTPLTASAKLLVNGVACADAEVLRDGCDRDNVFACRIGDTVSYAFDAPVHVKEVRIVFDSDLDRTTLPGDICERHHTMRANLLPDAPVMHLPTTLCRSYTVEALLEDGGILTLAREENNLRRLVKIPVQKAVREIRFCGDSVHCGGKDIRLFTMELM